ncbi:MAG: hypothetical protein ACM3PP_02760 [Candidatus Saccharibacteria bacterium]
MKEQIQVTTEHLKSISKSLKNLSLILRNIDNELSHRIHDMALEGQIRFQVDNLWSMEHRRVLVMRDHAAKLVALLDRTAHDFEAADGRGSDDGAIRIGETGNFRSSTINKAIRITGRFEGSGFVNITGNFDGQGISLGFLQWNIGQGTLQPLLKKMNSDHQDLLKQLLGNSYDDFVKMLNSSREDQIHWAKSINDSNNHITEPWKSKLTSLCKTEEFQEIQTQAMDRYINKAETICQKYNLTTEKGFALAFDISVQNGGIKNKADRIIQTAVEQANKSGTPLNETQLMKVIANAVADSSKPRYHDDVLARKMTIVEGTGIVHKTKVDLKTDFGFE